jgi:hypothetical protein
LRYISEYIPKKVKGKKRGVKHGKRHNRRKTVYLQFLLGSYVPAILREGKQKMIPICFKTKIKPMGSSSWGVIVPKPIADLLDKNMEYDFVIREAERDPPSFPVEKKETKKEVF